MGLAQVAGDTVQDEMIARLTEPLAEGWIWCRAKTAGQSWTTDLFSALPDDPARRTAFLPALPSDWAVGLPAQEVPDVRDRFWSLAPAFPFPAEQPEGWMAARGRSTPRPCRILALAGQALGCRGRG